MSVVYMFCFSSLWAPIFSSIRVNLPIDPSIENICVLSLSLFTVLFPLSCLRFDPIVIIMNEKLIMKEEYEYPIHICNFG